MRNRRPLLGHTITGRSQRFKTKSAVVRYFPSNRKRLFHWSCRPRSLLWVTVNSSTASTLLYHSLRVCLLLCCALWPVKSMLCSGLSAAAFWGLGYIFVFLTFLLFHHWSSHEQGQCHLTRFLMIFFLELWVFCISPEQSYLRVVCWLPDQASLSLRSDVVMLVFVWIKLRKEPWNLHFYQAVLPSFRFGTTNTVISGSLLVLLTFLPCSQTSRPPQSLLWNEMRSGDELWSVKHGWNDRNHP